MLIYARTWNSALTSCIQQSFELYHKAQEEHAHHGSFNILPALGQALAGAGGTAVSNIIVYPLDLVVKRLQVQQRVATKPALESKSSDQDQDQDTLYEGLQDAVEKIYKHEGGLPAFYSGVIQDTFKSVVDSFLFFLAYNVLLRVRRKRATPGEHSRLAATLEKIGIGMLAGMISKGCTTPIQNVVTRMQTAAMASAARTSDGKPRTLGRRLNTREVVEQIYETKGLLGFWSGYSASILLTLNPSLTFFMESFLKRVLRTGDKPHAWVTFLLAATAKAFASTTLYPLSLAKSRAQAVTTTSAASSKPASKSRSKTPLDVLITIKQIGSAEGVQALYAGLSGEVLKGFFSHGLTMLVKQRIDVLMYSLYFLASARMKGLTKRAA